MAKQALYEAKINLPGMPAGTQVVLDPDEHRRLIHAHYLVLVTKKRSGGRRSGT